MKFRICFHWTSCFLVMDNLPYAQRDQIKYSFCLIYYCFVHMKNFIVPFYDCKTIMYMNLYLQRNAKLSSLPYMYVINNCLCEKKIRSFFFLFPESHLFLEKTYLIKNISLQFVLWRKIKK